MNTRSCKLIQVYNRLLTDISRKLGVPIGAPSELGMEWILTEGPRLDKQLLRFIETGGKPPEFPEWLTPLAELFITRRDATVLKELRQLLVFGYKLETPPNEQQLRAAQAAFLETDESIADFESYFNSNRGCDVYRSAKALISRVIANVSYERIMPSHGPGAVFPPCRPSEKTDFRTVYETIEPLFPFFEYFAGISMIIQEGIRLNEVLQRGDELVAKLVAVPKDSRGPRLIAVHPKESVWIQQGIRKSLEAAISRHPLSSGRIVFDDQTVNGSLALSSSADGAFCTIDLKEASDRLSQGLFDYLFGWSAKYYNAVRASKIQLLDGSLHTLRKYAPMGNATVFPVESLVFWALASVGVHRSRGIKLTEACRLVYVFGDDVIVPSDSYDYVIGCLVQAGFIPNADKCFHRGLFRESCGVDAFNGVDVTPHRLKKIEPSDLSNQVSICSLAKNMRVDDYEETASFLYQIVRRAKGVLPLGNCIEGSGLYEYVERDLAYLIANEPTLCWDTWLQRYETRITSAIPVVDQIRQCDWCHIQDSLLKITGWAPKTSSRGYALPRRSRPKRGWIPARWDSPPRETARDWCSKELQTLRMEEELASSSLW